MRCSGCNSEFENNEGILLNHVSRHHQLETLAECNECDRKFLIYRDVHYLKHARDAHGSDLSIITDNRQALLPRLRQLVRQLFFENHKEDDYEEDQTAMVDCQDRSY